MLQCKGYDLICCTKSNMSLYVISGFRHDETDVVALFDYDAA